MGRASPSAKPHAPPHARRPDGPAVLALILALPLLVGACGETTGPGGTGQVSVAFRAVSGGAAASFAAPTAGTPPAAPLKVAGSNGALTLESVHLVLNEFELERQETASCPDDEDDDLGDRDDDSEDESEGEGCEEFEAPPQFLQLPLGEGSGTVAVSQPVPAGTYTGLEFEVEELDDDEDDPRERQQIEQLRREIRSQFEKWPLEGSLRAEGTFAPADGEPRSFVAYFEAEIEIERSFPSPLTISDDGGGTVTVTVDPAFWFTRPDGTVLDLSADRFDCTGRSRCPVTEFEIEMEDGFREIETDEDDD